MHKGTRPSMGESIRNLLETRVQDWTEDFAHENGCYLCRCYVCDHTFFGHKRRVECKVCAQSKEG